MFIPGLISGNWMFDLMKYESEGGMGPSRLARYIMVGSSGL